MKSRGRKRGKKVKVRVSETVWSWSFVIQPTRRRRFSWTPPLSCMFEGGASLDSRVADADPFQQLRLWVRAVGLLLETEMLSLWNGEP
jgi:hypothetical protein